MLKRFAEKLKELDPKDMEFNKELWCSLLSTVTAQRDGRCIFRFRGSIEVEVSALYVACLPKGVIANRMDSLRLRCRGVLFTEHVSAFYVIMQARQLLNQNMQREN